MNKIYLILFSILITGTINNCEDTKNSEEIVITILDQDPEDFFLLNNNKTPLEMYESDSWTLISDCVQDPITCIMNTYTTFLYRLLYTWKSIIPIKVTVCSNDNKLESLYIEFTANSFDIKAVEEYYNTKYSVEAAIYVAVNTTIHWEITIADERLDIKFVDKEDKQFLDIEVIR